MIEKVPDSAVKVSKFINCGKSCMHAKPFVVIKNVARKIAALVKVVKVWYVIVCHHQIGYVLRVIISSIM